jgi:glucosamine-6-phosphate deaminase
VIAPLRSVSVDQLRVSVFETNEAMGFAAAELASAAILAAIQRHDAANVVLAAANSQLTFLRALRTGDRLPWEAVTLFQMDEYLDLDPEHEARLAAFLKRELVDHVHVGTFHALPGSERDVDEACREYDALLRSHPLDVCVLGIGENGHLAFNDPPSVRFDDPQWVRKVRIDERSRAQQVGEGHFPRLDSVPKRAVTLTVPALVSAQTVLCLVPESRKAAAVRRTLTGPIDPSCPASILRRAPLATLFLDLDSAGSTLDELK